MTHDHEEQQISYAHNNMYVNAHALCEIEVFLALTGAQAVLISVCPGQTCLGQSIFNFLTQRTLKEHSDNNQRAIREHSDNNQRAIREQSESNQSIKIRVIQSEPKILRLVT